MGTSHLEKGQGEVFTLKIRPPPPQIWLYLKKFNRNTFVSSSWDCKLKWRQQSSVICVAVQHGPKGPFQPESDQLAENNGFETASLAERGTKVKDIRTVAHGGLGIQCASSPGGTSETPSALALSRTGDIGWRQVVDYSPIGRGSALGGVGSLPPSRFKTFLFIKIEGWYSVRIYGVKWYAYMWANSSMARETALAGGRKAKVPPTSHFFYLSR